MTKTYDELLELIYESKLSDDISTKMQSMRKSKFMEKFHYDPKKKTIEVNGRKFKVDLDTDKKTVEIKTLTGKTVTKLRYTAAYTDMRDPLIVFDSMFFRIRGEKSREAVLQHEIGHTRMHGLNPIGKHRDRAFAYKGTIEDKAQYRQDPEKLTDDDREKLCKKLLRKPVVRLWLISGSKEVPKEVRDEIRETLNQYSLGGHSCPMELEADRYAANQTSERAMISALKQLGAIEFKDYEKDTKEYVKKRLAEDKEFQKNNPHLYPKRNMRAVHLGYKYKVKRDLKKVKHDIKNDPETKMRIKALKDKKLRNAEIYKRDVVAKEAVEAWMDGYLTDADFEFVLESVNLDMDTACTIYTESVVDNTDASTDIFS